MYETRLLWGSPHVEQNIGVQA